MFIWRSGAIETCVINQERKYEPRTDGGTTWPQMRERQIASMRLTCEILGHILRKLSAEDARALRDGPDGWSIIEIVCHLRDFDEIFHSRARMMLELEHPQLPAYDHEAMAIERNYQAESLDDAYGALKLSRAQFVAFFEALTPGAVGAWRCTSGSATVSA